jgi:hypothetical protein
VKTEEKRGKIGKRNLREEQGGGVELLKNSDN